MTTHRGTPRETPATIPTPTPPDWHEYWGLTTPRKKLWAQATAQGRRDAEALMRTHDSPAIWETLSHVRGVDANLISKLGYVQAARLLGVDAPLVEVAEGHHSVSVPTEDALLAFRWYDIAYRCRLDEALDADPRVSL